MTGTRGCPDNTVPYDMMTRVRESKEKCVGADTRCAGEAQQPSPLGYATLFHARFPFWLRGRVSNKGPLDHPRLEGQPGWFFCFTLPLIGKCTPDSSGSGYNLILRSWIDLFPELVVQYCT